MNYRAKAVFYRQLGVMLASGLDLVRALKQLPLPALYNTVLNGSTLAEAMRGLPAPVFSRFEISVARAGEQSGNLAETINRLAGHFEFLDRTRARFLNGLIYPAVLLHAAIIIPAVPALILQGPGRFLGLVLPPLLVIYGCIFGFTVVRRTLGTASPVMTAWDELLIRIPVFGRLARTTALVRFIQSLVCLVSAGVGVVESVRLAAETMGNSVMEREMMKAVPLLQKGNGLAESFAGSRFVPPLLADMLATGEESGRIDESLGRVAEYLQQEVEAAVERIITIVPVIVYLIIAAYIGYIIISFYAGYIGQVNSLMGS